MTCAAPLRAFERQVGQGCGPDAKSVTGPVDAAAGAEWTGKVAPSTATVAAGALAGLWRRVISGGFSRPELVGLRDAIVRYKGCSRVDVDKTTLAWGQMPNVLKLLSAPSFIFCRWCGTAFAFEWSYSAYKRPAPPPTVSASTPVCDVRSQWR
jgi:hypothetical protein